MISLDLHIVWFVLGGVALLAMTVLPGKFASRPLSLPIVYVAAGFLVFWAVGPLFGPDPTASSIDAQVLEYVTELIVIVSLAAAGLKIDRPMGLRTWSNVWRLLSITMVLTVVAAIVLGVHVLGLGLGAAILLGAVLAPTDPVLADDVQVEEPGSDHENEVRFTLTAEAGLNDSLAFPITYLAIAVVGAGGSFSAVAGSWLTTDVGYRIAVGAAMGWLMGRLLVWFGHRSGEFAGKDTSEGLFVLGAILVVYGVTEVVNGYGFLAVFIAALSRGDDDYRDKKSGFADQLEAMLLAFVLLGFGALIAEGILADLTWRGALVALGLVIVVRPVAGLIGLTGTNLPRSERWAISFFGIRGMGSIYYLAYAGNHADFVPAELSEVWAVTSLTIIISIVLHGVTASPAMRYVDRCRRDPTARLYQPTATTTSN